MMDSRFLTPEETDVYTVRLAAVGYTFAALGGDQPYGFDVYGESVRYSYRYDATRTTAVELMDSICEGLGA